MTNNKRKTFILTPKTLEMIDKLKDEMGFKSMTEVVSYAIAYAFRKELYNKYKMAGAPQGESLMSEREKLKEKQRVKLEQRKIDKEIKEEAAANYCINELEGVIVEYEGVKSCKYPPLKEFPDATRTRPLSQLI